MSELKQYAVIKGGLCFKESGWSVKEHDSFIDKIVEAAESFGDDIQFSCSFDGLKTEKDLSKQKTDNSDQKTPWTMPKWMERFCCTPSLGNHKKEAIEEYYNDKTHIDINAFRALIACDIKSRVDTLYDLYRQGEID